MASILETRSVTKKFGGFTAVDNVSLSVEPGEIRFIIGPNGAGKSTFFKLVIGIHSPNTGTILYKGQNIEKLKLHERINLGMGVKFQAPSVFSELTVLQNLSLLTKVKRRGAQADKVAAAVPASQNEDRDSDCEESEDEFADL